MNEFRTIVEVGHSADKLKVGDKVFTMGSCFSDEITDRLMRKKIECNSNPYGVVYNPMSIERQVERIVYKAMDYPDVEVVVRDGAYHSLMAHSKLGADSKEQLTENLRAATAKAHEDMKLAKMIVLTLGTAWVYKYMRFVVANCHKLPASDFDRVMMAVNEVSLSLRNAIRMIRQLNDEAIVVLTVSPIRHLKDTAHGNAISKSTLLLGVEDAIMRAADPKVVYFPSYEIILDDLRDYRFYAEDMVHPSEVAVDYVFEKFMDVYFDDKLKEYAKEGESLSKLMAHRPMGHESDIEKHMQTINEKLGLFNEKWGTRIC